MKRLVWKWAIAAVAGFCSLGPVMAQEGVLAPTSPVVPAPVIQGGKLINPSGGQGSWGASNTSQMFSAPRWSPFRNSVSATATDPVAPMVSLAPGAPIPGAPIPPPPVVGVGTPNGSCEAGGCGSDGRVRSKMSWSRLKAWMTYHHSNTDLPRFHPTPYVTPLMGMFPCPGGGYGGCGSCANGSYPAYGPPVGPANGVPSAAPPTGYPLGQPQPYLPQPMPQPGSVGRSGAGPVMMPQRGVQGAALTPTWQGRITPMPASNPGIAGYRFAAPESFNGITNASANVPQR